MKIPDAWLPLGGVLGGSGIAGWFLLRSKRIENESKSRELDLREQELDLRRVSEDNLLANQIRIALKEEREHLEADRDRLTNRVDELTGTVTTLNTKLDLVLVELRHANDGQAKAEKECKRLNLIIERERREKIEKGKQYEADKITWQTEKEQLTAEMQTLFRSNELHEIAARNERERQGATLYQFEVYEAEGGKAREEV